MNGRETNQRMNEQSLESFSECVLFVSAFPGASRVMGTLPFLPHRAKRKPKYYQRSWHGRGEISTQLNSTLL